MDSVGLTQTEAERRLKKYGLNTFQSKGKPLILQFLGQFLSPFIIILLFAAFISAYVGDTNNFIIITIIVVLSGTIDFYQQYHAQTAIEKLRQKVSLTATVIRDGQQTELLFSQIVVGDVIKLNAGDIIPADARITTSNELTVDQSTLTGESFPQEKKNAEMVFMGTHVISGEATAEVTQTSKNTKLGKIADQITKQHPETEFSQGIKRLGYFLMKITFSLTIIVFFINAFIKHDVLGSFLFSLALAVGITPELLPIIVTITLSRGAGRMAKKDVIVKNLPAIQNFGSMNILCTDKTGTLTEGTIHLEKYTNLQTFHFAYINSFFQTNLKNSLDESILEHQKIEMHTLHKVDEIPYDFFRKRMSVVITEHKKTVLVTKGAFAEMLAICDLSHEEKEKLQEVYKAGSEDGYRILAVAVKEVGEQKSYTPKDEKHLTFIGLLYFEDKPKKAIQQALEIIEKQGVLIKVLTGDNELVTKKICAELGLPVLGILTGADVATMNDEALQNMVDQITIFARLDPNDKERIVAAFKKRGHVVGYLGDGINDAPALHAADVGISVNNAVDIAKESADLILLRKDLHVLKEGIYEGRKTYGNVMKYIMMSTSSNFGNMFSVALGSLFLPFLPMLPIQILLNNLLYDLSQLFIPNDNVTRDYLNKPHGWNINFIKEFMFVFGPLSSAVDFLTFFTLLVILKATVPLFQTGWFIESLVTQTFIVFSIRTKLVPFFKSKPSKLLILSSCSIAFIGLIIPFTPLAKPFFFTPPPILFYFFLSGLLVFYFLMVELAKTWFYRHIDLRR